MDTKIIFLLCMFGVASSTLPHIRECDPEEKRQTPTLCSNYKNILHIYKFKEDLEASQEKLQKRINAVETSRGNSTAAIERLMTNLTEALNELKEVKAQQKNDNAGIAKTLQKLAGENSKLKEELESLKSQASAKVAFSASVIESPNVFTGPATDISGNILVFNKVFTNIGNAYNSKTGIFTAPVKGTYHFTFMTFGYCTHTSGAILVKNGHYQVSTWEFKGLDSSDTTSNTAILNLNAGETVNIILWKGGKVHTSVFSGFLIFPVM
ncbi:uncharacterized protein LOC125004007 [Mugil cephalus]|uniref:uncharacterized protein LOC125004007 n=1 Tax=Mugil cephalus TaxID=48193 RepID=UPI001FB6D008|nr:uncharacterized protein LOC125004007 [Mugil cephalus]